MLTNFGRGIQEGAIAGAAGGFAGTWLLVLGLSFSEQFSGITDREAMFTSLLAAFVLGFVGMFVGTPIGALIGVVIGGIYGALGVDRSAPLITAALMGSPLPVAGLASVAGGGMVDDGAAAADWAFGLLVIGLTAGIGYFAGVIWRNGMRRHRVGNGAAPAEPMALAYR